MTGLPVREYPNLIQGISDISGMFDSSGHHIVYGELQDYLTGETLKDTDDERIRQQLALHLVEELGYAPVELEPRLSIVSEFNGNRVESRIELCACIEGKRLFILRYGPGSLVTREKAAIAAAKRQDALRQQSSKSKKLEKTRKAKKELDRLHKTMYDRTKLYEGPKSLDDHKKENRTPKKHGQPSVTRGVRKQ